jgi:hypothetical protein
MKPIVEVDVQRTADLIHRFVAACAATIVGMAGAIGNACISLYFGDADRRLPFGMTSNQDFA